MCKTYFSSVFSFDESPGSFLLSGEEVGGNSYTLDERGFKKKKTEHAGGSCTWTECCEAVKIGM